ncbi:MAG: TonB-dependent receptor [Lentimicrobiaceae bacterium]
MTKKLLFLPFLFISLFSYSQIFFRGQVLDASNGQSIPGANIVVDSLQQGTISDESGYFILNLTSGMHTMTISYIGYSTYKTEFKVSEIKNFIKVELEPLITGLDEVTILSDYAKERETPVAMSNIKPAVIELQMGNQDYPEIMKMVPGVYATKLGGGTGDARISIRGFQQENIALLLNGVPVGSVENGLVYWSNWAGLGDATQTIQVQRGLGASRVALNSVGGTINIITKSTEAKKGGSIRYSVSDYGNHKTTLSLSTGKLKNNYAVTFLGSHTEGPGYIDATSVNSWAYFLTISKQINEHQSIVFTGLGAPERHGQRTYGLTKEQYDLYGNKYNPDWGMFNGKINSLAENFYHKPQLSIIHYLEFNKGLLSTSAYVSFGTGGGNFSESFMSESALTFRKNNQVDWDAIYLQNVNNQDYAQLQNGQSVTGFSKIIQTEYLASHVWYGALSNLNYQFNDNLKLITGLHARYFKSNLREEISNLFGGKYWIDNYSWAIEGIGNRNQVKGVGDIINVDNDSRVDIVSYFLQMEYSFNKFTFFGASTLSQNWYRRYDRINYITDTKSDLVSKFGYDFKAGGNYNIDKHHNLYFNTGYYSKAPYFKFVFANFSNAVVERITNEKISAAELGYGYNKRSINVDLNLYYTLWQDKSLLSKENIQLDNNQQTRALIRGLDAVHKGVELEASAELLHNLDMGFTFSWGDWKWSNDVDAELYDNDQVLIDSTKVYSKGLWVGDAPQLQVGLTGDLRLPGNFTLNANWLYFDRIYANFDPAGRNDPNDRTQPYRIPSYHTINLHIIYDFLIGGLKTTASTGIYNLLNKESIMRGEDGNSHDIYTFTGFWSPGRTFNFSIKVAF